MSWKKFSSVLINTVNRILELDERVNVMESLGVPHNLPRVPALSFVDYDNFGKKIANSGNKYLLEYHEITKYRLGIAEYCLKSMLDNYDDDIAFVAGLTGLLVKGKAALDSLCQEINLYCKLNIGQRRDYVTDTQELTEPHTAVSLKEKCQTKSVRSSRTKRKQPLVCGLYDIMTIEMDGTENA